MRLNIRPYVAIARPDHWVKNVFVLPGALVAALGLEISFSSFAGRLALGLISVCLLASANYVINEWLDAAYDRFHPTKRLRASVAGDLCESVVYLEYVLLAAAGLLIAAWISLAFLLTAGTLLAMGILYNVSPFRTKDRAVMDVLSESLNNPIRLALGWFVVTTLPLPPSSLVVSYWMGGAFLMAIKRFGEYRFIGDAEAAGAYRRSFRYYTEEKLLISSFFYAMMCGLFLGVFLVKYRIELLLSLPFVALLFAWYFHLAFKPNSPVQYPERLKSERGFMLYGIFLAILIVALLRIDLSPLHWFLQEPLTLR
jgi:4-hydroxybenzoate polyprenyltransferase